MVCEKIVNQDAIKNNIQSEESNTQPTSNSDGSKNLQGDADQIHNLKMKNVSALKIKAPQHPPVPDLIINRRRSIRGVPSSLPRRVVWCLTRPH